MNTPILPEGRLLNTAENRAACASEAGLLRALAQEEILEGTALQCDKAAGILVELGGFVGRIPWEETAFGLEEGRVREVAVLSRVGQCVCFTVSDLRWEAGRPALLLSRRRAQELAWDHLSRLDAGTVIPATVTRLDPFGAFVDMGCGLPSMIGVDRISVSRIPHPDQRFHVGQEILAAVLGRDLERCRLLLTHRELLGTWAENAARFSPGMTVPGMVRSVKSYGIFIELTPNFSGLAEPRPDLREGDRVSVYIKSILPERMKCKLLVIGPLPPAPPRPPRYFLPPSGRLDRWIFAPEQAQRTAAETVFLPQGPA